MRHKSKKFRLTYAVLSSENGPVLNCKFYWGTIDCKLQVKEQGKWVDIPFVHER